MWFYTILSVIWSINFHCKLFVGNDTDKRNVGILSNSFENTFKELPRAMKQTEIDWKKTTLI